MPAVSGWTGREIKALRQAMRMSTAVFAAHLGVSDRMVSKWEAGGDRIRPRLQNQAVLDACLAGADLAARARFDDLVGERALPVPVPAVTEGVQVLARHPIDGKLMTLIDAGPFE